MFRRVVGNKKGQALVELALILPILLLLVFGVVEYGRIFAAYLTVTNGSREGARIATVGGTDTDIITSVKFRTSAMNLDGTKVIVKITPNSANRTRGNSVTVEVTYPVTMYDPFFTTIVGASYTVKGKTIMRVE